MECKYAANIWRCTSEGEKEKWGGELIWPVEDKKEWEKVFNLYTPLRDAEVEVKADLATLIMALGLVTDDGDENK